MIMIMIIINNNQHLTAKLKNLWPSFLNQIGIGIWSVGFLEGGKPENPE